LHRGSLCRSALLALALGATIGAGDAVAASAAAVPPRLRLGDDVRPIRYEVQLQVVPASDTFAGAVAIDLEVRRTLPRLWLNATELTVDRAELEVGGETLPLRVVPGGADFVGFEPERPIQPGSARLHVAYRGMMSEKERLGLFRRKELGHWYTVSQFEPIAARKAFPCFDEPSFKTPWQLTLLVRPEDEAFSNTPVVAESRDPDGMKRVRFAETKPLCSYHIALAVGPFEVVDAGRGGKKRTQIRILTPRGRAGEAGFVKRSTPTILALLEDYFDIPYPFEKLDVVAVPQFMGMENPGLVTAEQTLLLAPPGKQSLEFQRGLSLFMAHELAHQWFGNLVTMAWWDDIWLNEGLATWIESKIVDRWQPQWKEGLDSRVSGSHWAMSVDSAVTARRVRQPITSNHDIENAFDNITYGKAAAVMRMLEDWVGPERFQQAIRRHLRARAWTSATAGDFVKLLSQAAGRDLAPALATFLDQTGVPVVTVALNGERGRAARLILKQSRYLPLGSPISAAERRRWRIPVKVSYSDGKRERTVSLWLDRERMELPLPGVTGNVSWVLANPGRVGYYRVRYEGRLLSQILRAGGGRLSIADRTGIARDLAALVGSGEYPAGKAPELAPRLIQPPDVHVVRAAVEIVPRLSRITSPSLLPAYRRYLRRTYGSLARDMGFQPRPGESADTRALRRTLLYSVGGEGRDPLLIAEAKRLLGRWLVDRDAVDTDLVRVVLTLAAQNGDRTLFDRLLPEARRTRDPQERFDLLYTLGLFRDPSLVRQAFQLVLSEEFPVQESQAVLWGPLDEPQLRDLPYQFVKENFAALVARFPTDWRAGLVGHAGTHGDERRLADVETFFKGRVEQFVGGPRTLARHLERMRQTIGLRRAQGPSLEAFLRTQ
jgi:alanyl aminopeptidase